jgi:hypothetical protein
VKPVRPSRPGDKVILLREHLGSAAERDIEKRKEGEKEMELERQKKLRSVLVFPSRRKPKSMCISLLDLWHCILENREGISMTDLRLD